MKIRKLSATIILNVPTPFLVSMLSTMVGFPYCLFDMLTINLVISNVGYLVAGGGFLLLIALTKPKEDGIHGLHTDMSLYYSMGLSIIFTGVFSALYHVCPSNLNFQFGMSSIVEIEKLT